MKKRLAQLLCISKEVNSQSQKSSVKVKTMKKMILVLLCFVLSTAALPAVAQSRPVWRGHIDHFHEHDIVVWRGGHWFHGWHGNRLGWWWIVGPGWYWYPAPIYPYPNPYVPPAVVQAPPAPPAQPQALPPTWYYCDRPRGYYPYVPECSSGWRAVPATPPPTGAAPVPPPSVP